MRDTRPSRVSVIRKREVQVIAHSAPESYRVVGPAAPFRHRELSAPEQEALQRQAVGEGIAMEEAARSAVGGYVARAEHRDRVGRSAERVLTARAEAPSSLNPETSSTPTSRTSSCWRHASSVTRLRSGIWASSARPRRVLWRRRRRRRTSGDLADASRPGAVAGRGPAAGQRRPAARLALDRPVRRRARGTSQAAGSASPVDVVSPTGHQVVPLELPRAQRPPPPATPRCRPPRSGTAGIGRSSWPLACRDPSSGTEGVELRRARVHACGCLDSRVGGPRDRPRLDPAGSNGAGLPTGLCPRPVGRRALSGSGRGGCRCRGPRRASRGRARSPRR